MKYSNINIDRAPLSQADIAKGQNFAKLLKHVQPTPWYQTTWFYVTTGIAVAGIAVASIFLLPALNGEEAMAENHQSEPAIVLADSLEQTTEAPSAINPPFGDIKEWIHLQVNAEAGGEYTAGKSTIIIPAMAFEDKDGEQITGFVDIRYREYTDKIDLFLSGIPMEYDSAGTTFTFETAGMFELRGAQEGRDVSIATGKTLDVSMKSNNPSNEFNQYVLDEASGTWEYQSAQVVNRGTQVAEIADDTTDLDLLDLLNTDPLPFEEDVELWSDEALLEDDLDTTTSLRPMLAPVVADPEKFQIEIDYDKSAFPELAAYDDVLFEIAEDEVEEAKEQASNAWNEVDIERRDAGNYQLTFKRGDASYQVEAYPVIPEDNMANAKANFEKRQKAYQEKLKARREAEQAAAARRRQQQIQSQNYAIDGMVQRSFMVNSFGIFNSDCPRNLPKGAVVQATYKDPSGISLKNMTGTQHLVELNREIMFNLYGNMDLQYNPRRENMVWIATADGRVAVVTPEQLKAARGKKVEFECQVSTPIRSEADIRFFLEPYITGDYLSIAE